MMNDPIADMFTRIRNAYKARFEVVEMPSSNIKLNIARIFKNEGYIKDYKMIKDNKQGILQLFLKYDTRKSPAISELKRVSKPSRRIYVNKDNIPQIKNGLGLVILSTSKGLFTGKDASKEGIGGEVICSLW